MRKVTTVPSSSGIFTRRKHLDEEVVIGWKKERLVIKRVRDLRTIELFSVSDDKYAGKEIIRRYQYLENLHDKRLKRKGTVWKFLKTELNDEELKEYRLLRDFLQNQDALRRVTNRQYWPRNVGIRIQSM
jgi:hypothetical protein